MTRNALGRLGPLLALILLVLAGSFMNPAFMTFENIFNVLTRSSVIGIIAIGATFVITGRGLDLSVGAMMALVAGLAVLAMNGLMAPLGPLGAVVAGLALAIAFGGLAGLFNGGFVVWGRIDAFIVTLGTMGIMRALITWMSDGGSISLDFSLRDIGRPLYYGTILSIPIPVLIFAALAVLGEIAMTRLRFGRHVTAIGSNPEVARHSAIHVDRVRLATYILQGLCVGLATIIYIPRLGSVTPSTGLMWELEAIAAVIIGGTVLTGGYGRVWGTVTGVLILGVIANILNLTSYFSPHLNGAFQGAIIVIAVLLQRKNTAG